MLPEQPELADCLATLEQQDHKDQLVTQELLAHLGHLGQAVQKVRLVSLVCKGPPEHLDKKDPLA